MAIDALQIAEIIEVMESFIEKKRPPARVRKQVDLTYKIEGQSIIIFEVRPRWDKPQEIMECHIAKTTFVQSKKLWKVFWMRSDLKWHSYSPKPTVNKLKDFTALVAEDKNHCFFG